MPEKHTRQYYWRLADLLPQEKLYGKYRALWYWVWMVGPVISIEEGKGWTLGFCFYLFAFFICRKARPVNMDSRFTGLELFWVPTQWEPSRLQPFEKIWRYESRIGRYSR